MKSKDMTIGKLYLTQANVWLGQQVVRLVAFEDVPTYSNTSFRRTGRTMKKLRLALVTADYDGSIVERTQASTFTPGQLLCEMDEQCALDRVRSTTAMKLQQDEDRLLCDEYGKTMVDLMHTAGFGEAQLTSSGIYISQHQVAEWVRRQQ